VRGQAPDATQSQDNCLQDATQSQDNCLQDATRSQDNCLQDATQSQDDCLQNETQNQDVSCISSVPQEEIFDAVIMANPLEGSPLVLDVGDAHMEDLVHEYHAKRRMHTTYATFVRYFCVCMCVRVYLYMRVCACTCINVCVYVCV
jgi:hypothetical protein